MKNNYVKFGDLFDIGSSKRVFESDWRTSGVPFYRTREIVQLAEKGYVDNEIFISEDMYENYIRKYGKPSPGDLMVTGVGTLGVCYVVKENDKFYFKDGNVLWFKKIKDVNSEYIKWSFSSKRVRDQITRSSSGTTVGTYTISSAKLTTIPLPSKETQEKIVATLNSIFCMKLLYEQQLLQIDNLISSFFYSMFGDPFENREGKKLGEVCILNPKKSELLLGDDEQISFIPMQSVSEYGEINASESRHVRDVKSGFTYFCENDVLFAKITPCMENGKGAIARGLVNGVGFGSTEFHVLRPIDGVSTSEWLYCLTALPEFRKLAESNMTGSAGQKRVPASFFTNLKVSVPPLELQNRFAEIVNKIEEQKALVKKAIEETQMLFDSLMSKYFDD